MSTLVASKASGCLRNAVAQRTYVDQPAQKASSSKQGFETRFFALCTAETETIDSLDQTSRTGVGMSTHTGFGAPLAVADEEESVLSDAAANPFCGGRKHDFNNSELWSWRNATRGSRDGSKSSSKVRRPFVK